MAIDVPPQIAIEKENIIDETLKTGHKLHHNVTPDAVNNVKYINDAAADRPNFVETEENRGGMDGLAVAEDLSRFVDDMDKNVLPLISDEDLAADEVNGSTIVPNEEGGTSLSIVTTNAKNEYSTAGLSLGVLGLSASDVKGDGTSPLANRVARTGEDFFGDKIYKDSKESMKVRNSLFDSLRSSGNAQGFGILDGESQALMLSKHIWRGGYIGEFDDKSLNVIGGNREGFMSILMFSTAFNETGFSQTTYNLGKNSNFHKIGTKKESKGGTDVGGHQINVDSRYRGTGVDKKKIARYIDTNYSASYALALEEYKSQLNSIQRAVNHMPKSINSKFQENYTPQMLATLAAGGFNGGREGSTKIWDNLGSKENPKWKVNEDYFKALTGDLSAKPIKINIDPSNIGTNIMRQVFTALDFQGTETIGFADLAKNPNTLPARILRMKITNRGETMTALEYVKKYRPVELDKAKKLYSKKSIDNRRVDLEVEVNQDDRGGDLKLYTDGLVTPISKGQDE